MSTAFGKFYTFKPPESITLDQHYCMTIVLVRNFTYTVFVHDEKFFSWNANPLGPPVNYWAFDGSSQRNQYQELTLTKHKKLNRNQRPCNEDPSYSFRNCIRESLSKQVNSCKIWFNLAKFRNKFKSWLNLSKQFKSGKI